MNTEDPDKGYGIGTFDQSNLYVDSGVMTEDQFRWSGLEDSVAGGPSYNYDILNGEYITKGKVNDCNEVPDKYLYLFPACNACVGLNYAGFAEGWRLPSQRISSHIITTNCSEACGRTHASGDKYRCAPGRQLWDFGMENCNWIPDLCESSPPQNACHKGAAWTIKWDKNAFSGYYWSSTQHSGSGAWSVNFYSASVYSYSKSSLHFCVRCFLGQWP